MKRFLVVPRAGLNCFLLFVISSGVLRAATPEMSLLFPSHETDVVCDKRAGFCADAKGISFPQTNRYLGERALKQLQRRFSGTQPQAHFTFSNGVYCSLDAQGCYRDSAMREPNLPLTQRLFGHSTQQAKFHVKTGIYFPSHTSQVVCDATAGFCADAQGISFGLTSLYLGTHAHDVLLLKLTQAQRVVLKRFVLSNGVVCDSRLSVCFTDASAQRLDTTLTRRLFRE
ncbi:TPA: YcgJ family protein [Serratia marcescens]